MRVLRNAYYRIWSCAFNLAVICERDQVTIKNWVNAKGRGNGTGKGIGRGRGMVGDYGGDGASSGFYYWEEENDAQNREKNIEIQSRIPTVR